MPAASWRCRLTVLAVWATATLPFLDKAYTIDDTAYLAIARQISVDPWRPYSFSFNWGTVDEPAFTIRNPPLLPAFLAAAIRLDGGREREVVLHLAVSLFTALGAYALYRLGERFGTPPALACAAVLLSPAVLPGTNVMLDTPTLALFAASILLHVDGTDRRAPARLAAAAAVAGLAILTRYNVVVLLPILASYSLLRRRPRDLAYLAIPVAIVGLWCLHNLSVYGQVHVLAHAGVIRASKPLADNAVAALGVVGASALWIPLVAHRDWRSIPAAAVAVAVALPLAANIGRDRWEAFLFFSNGLFLAAMLLPALIRDLRGLATRSGADRELGSRAFLWTWCAATILFAWFLPDFQATRHYVIALPALVLLAGWGASRRRALLAAVPTTILGLSVAAADAELSGCYRTVAAQIARQEVPPGCSRWFVGHWGWQYYAERNGIRRLDQRPQAISSGDVLVIPRGVDREPLSPEMEARFAQGRSFSIERRIPLRTHMDGSGLYSAALPRDVPYAATPRPILDVFYVLVAR